MAKARSQAKPARGKLRWPFSRRRNRRVRPPSVAVPVADVAREPSGATRPASVTAKVQALPKPASPRGKQPLVAIGLLLVVAGSAVGAHRLITRSKHFVVKTIKLGRLEHVSAEALQARAATAIGANLFSVDLKEIEHKLAEEPWVKEAHARRELPSTVAVDVVEREAACVVALNALYLADARGNVFKRANPDEAAALPVVTGIDRDAYLSEPELARAHVREALTVAQAWQKASRPALGEVHWDRLLGITVYTRDAVGVRLGQGDSPTELDERLHRFDAVWTALQRSGEKARLIHLDNRARPDRVTVRLASPTPVEQVKSGELRGAKRGASEAAVPPRTPAEKDT